jgi:hypothetical protein
MDNSGHQTPNLVQSAAQSAGRGSVRYYPENKIWGEMIRRCTVPTSSGYKWYGARGIRVCERWVESFWNFYDDMGPRPDNEHSIDRIDNDGDYTPANCRWALPSVQSANKRDHSRPVPIPISPPPSEAQRRWYDAIVSLRESGTRFSLRTLKAAVGGKSTNAAADMLRRLELGGYIQVGNSLAGESTTPTAARAHEAGGLIKVTARTAQAELSVWLSDDAAAQLQTDLSRILQRKARGAEG